MQERMEESRLKSLANEERERLSVRERELLHYRETIQKQERDLEVYRARLKEEQLARERELQREMEAREKFFAEREKKLVERQREAEIRQMHRQAETEALRQHLEEQIAKREVELTKALSELEQEKLRYTEESRKKIERTSKDYVVDALELLEKKERQFHFISKVWGGVGAGSLIVAIAFFAFLTLTSVVTLPSVITWEFLTFAVFKGLIGVALLAGLAKYSFLFSSSYMQEALKNADRRHAINFGKFYLESYGAAADWGQVKEAFEHWNISGANAFTRTEEASVDIGALEKAVAMVEKATQVIKKSKGESS